MDWAELQEYLQYQSDVTDDLRDRRGVRGGPMEVSAMLQWSSSDEDGIGESFLPKRCIHFGTACTPRMYTSV